MQITLILISALTPVAVLLWYIYRKDKVQPEPTKWLLKAFVLAYYLCSFRLCFLYLPVSCSVWKWMQILTLLLEKRLQMLSFWLQYLKSWHS